MQNNLTSKPSNCIDCGSTQLKPAFERMPKDANLVQPITESDPPNDTFYLIVECKDCGSVFLHPYYFDEATHIYSEPRYFTGYFPDNIHTGGGPCLTAPSIAITNRWKNRRSARRFLHMADLPQPKGLKILEIGCGRGDLVRGFCDLGADASGIDLAEDAVAASRKNGINVMHGYLEDLEIPENSFDLIIARQVFEHIQDLNDICTSIHRVLKPQGKLVIEVPNDLEGYRNKTYNGIWWMIPPIHVRYFTASSARKIFDCYGLELVDQATSGYFGGDLSLVLGWKLRKRGLSTLAASLPMRLLFKCLKEVSRPIDALISKFGRHSELTLSFRLNDSAHINTQPPK